MPIRPAAATISHVKKLRREPEGVLVRLCFIIRRGAADGAAQAGPPGEQPGEDQGAEREGQDRAHHPAAGLGEHGRRLVDEQQQEGVGDESGDEQAHRDGGQELVAVSMGLLVTGLIADAFLLLLIYKTAAMFAEASRWMVGAVLTFPFGTLVFAWLLARRARLGGPVGRPTPDDEA